MGALEPVLAADRPAQRDDGILFGVGGQQAGNQIGGARTGRHQHDTRGAGEATDRTGDERRVLFVATHHQLRAAIDQGVVYGVDLGAGHTEDVFDPLG